MGVGFDRDLAPSGAGYTDLLRPWGVSRMHCRLIWPLLLATVASGQTITNFAGNGLVGYQGDNGPATGLEVELDKVVGLAADAAGNIYLTDQNNDVVRKVDTSGFITTFAGVGAAGFNGDAGLATRVKLDGPQGVCAAPSGVVYVTDPGSPNPWTTKSGS